MIDQALKDSIARLASSDSSASIWIILHSISLFIWIIMLFVQPILIQSKLIGLHKRIGRASKLVAGTLVLTTLITCVNSFLGSADTMELGKRISVLSAQTVGMGIFTGLYLLTLKESRNFIMHAYAIIGSLIVIVGPLIFRNVNTYQLELLQSLLYPRSP